MGIFHKTQTLSKQTNKKEDNPAGIVTAEIATCNESSGIWYSLVAAEVPKLLSLFGKALPLF